MELLIEVPLGYEIDKERSIPFEKIVFKEIEDKLPMSIEEIPNRDWFINNKGEVSNNMNDFDSKDKNNLSTKERAEAFLALMQLVELRDAYNGDWKIDHLTPTQDRYNIYIIKGVEKKISFTLCFKSLELKDKFEEQFKELIKTAKELL